MKIAILILYTTGWQELADIVVPNAELYCKKHGYFLETAIFNDPMPSNFGFNKIMYISDMFELNEADVIWSLDMDTLITNHNFRVEDFITEQNNFWITKDVNGVNAGSFIARKSGWWKYFSKWILEYQQIANCEQDAIDLYYEEHNGKEIGILPHPSINSYDYSLYPEFPDIRKEEQGHWHPGNFLLHLPGVGMNKRLEILKHTSIVK